MTLARFCSRCGAKLLWPVHIVKGEAVCHKCATRDRPKDPGP